MANWSEFSGTIEAANLFDLPIVMELLESHSNLIIEETHVNELTMDLIGSGRWFANLSDLATAIKPHCVSFTLHDLEPGNDFYECAYYDSSTDTEFTFLSDTYFCQSSIDAYGIDYFSHILDTIDEYCAIGEQSAVQDYIDLFKANNVDLPY